MSRRAGFVLAGLTAVAIFLAGLSYALVRTPSYQSTAALVLVPTPTNPNDVPNLIGSFNSSGSIGTYVELIASANTLQSAGSPPVSVGVRAVPDSRVIDVTTEGDRDSVQPALQRILTVVESQQASLRDAWTLQTIQAPQPAQQTGPTKTVIVVAAALLALVGALFVLVVLGRLSALAGGSPPAAPGEADEDAWVDEPLDRAREYR
jgi:uncharacterized protein involved in exopolysaccharide biosynthesis